MDIIRPRIKEAELENFLFSQSVHGLDERLSLSLPLLPEPRRERLRIGMWLVQDTASRELHHVVAVNEVL